MYEASSDQLNTAPLRSLQIQGTVNFNINISFGDDSSHHLYYSNVTSQQRSIDKGYLFGVTYRYNDSGSFLVRMNVSNAVSWMLADATAVVDVPISGVTLSADRDVAETLLPVKFTATAQSGENLQYRWRFGSEYRNTT